MQSFKVQGYKPELTDNLDQGDCYYSAIYRSAKHQNLLEHLFDCLRIPIDSEKYFIKAIREIVAASIEGGDARSSYESYKDTFENELETLKIQIEDSPGYLRKFLDKKIKEKEKSRNPDKVKFYTYDQYAKELSENIKQHKTWAGELEVIIVKNVLETCGIIIDFYSSNKGGKPPKLLPMKVGDKYYIYLYNENEIHWKHYILKGEPKTINLKRNTRKNITYTRWNNNSTKNSNLVSFFSNMKLMNATRRNSSNRNSNSNNNNNNNNNNTQHNYLPINSDKSLQTCKSSTVL